MARRQKRLLLCAALALRAVSFPLLLRIRVAPQPMAIPGEEHSMINARGRRRIEE
jgi:hypothetical protein